MDVIEKVVGKFKLQAGCFIEFFELRAFSLLHSASCVCECSEGDRDGIQSRRKEQELLSC